MEFHKSMFRGMDDVLRTMSQIINTLTVTSVVLVLEGLIWCLYMGFQGLGCHFASRLSITMQ